MMNYPQQQQPGMFPFLDEIEQRIHPVTGYVLAAIGAVGGFFFGLECDRRWPMALFVGLGLILGLLATALLKHLTGFVICMALVAAAAIGTYWLLANEAALRGQHAAAQTAPASQPKTVPAILNDLKRMVQP